MLKIYIVGAILVISQACATKTEINKESDQSRVLSDSTVLTVSERRAKLEQLKTKQAEKRRMELEERFKSMPYYTNAQGTVVYNKAEKDPAYIGGEKALMKYLNDNIVFPKEAEEKELEGTVFVDFVVTSTGDVQDVMVNETEEIDISFVKEAIRVVSTMPKWTPGSQNSKPVDVKFSLPITFQIL
jgi:TonB family protein